MPHVVVDLDSDVSPGRMLAAATDFSERRPELWPDISPGFWQLHDRGPNWAEPTEGSPSVWARERYEWSGNQVVGTTQESNVFRPGGTWTLTVKPRGGAGSHIRVNFDRRWKGQGLGLLPSRRPVRATDIIQAESAEDEDAERARAHRRVTRRDRSRDPAVLRR